jgi:transposase
MPAALSMRERRKIIERREQGHSFREIAEELKRNYETVRKLYHRYLQRGQLEPAYNKCSHHGVHKNEAVYQRAIQLKQAHPKWGAGLIWVELAEEFAEVELPSERTLQRWFRRGGAQNPAPERNPRPFAGRGKGAHEVWAMDAKEQVELGDGTFVSWLSVTDEGSGAILGAFLFPHQTLDKDRPDAGKSGAARPDDILGSSRENTDR